jgi:hypothetical protein
LRQRAVCRVDFPMRASRAGICAAGRRARRHVHVARRFLGRASRSAAADRRRRLAREGAAPASAQLDRLSDRLAHGRAVDRQGSTHPPIPVDERRVRSKHRAMPLEDLYFESARPSRVETRLPHRKERLALESNHSSHCSKRVDSVRTRRRRDANDCSSGLFDVGRSPPSRAVRQSAGCVAGTTLSSSERHSIQPTGVRHHRLWSLDRRARERVRRNSEPVRRYSVGDRHAPLNTPLAGPRAVRDASRLNRRWRRSKVKGAGAANAFFGARAL